MSNSSLVTYTNLSRKKSKRNNKIDSVIIHCFVGQVTAKEGCDFFATTDRDCSANYVIGKDGTIGLSVDESYRAWCSGGADRNNRPICVNGISGSDFDHRAIAIEVASDTTPPYAVTDKAYNSLIELLVDICRRNNIPGLLWQGNKSFVGQINKQNMGAHRWFAYKDCPGDYLYSHFGDIAGKVNAKLGPSAGFKQYLVKVTVDELNIRKGPSISYAVAGSIKDKGIYTIVLEDAAGAWGKLKSGVGWISLKYTKKI